MDENAVPLKIEVADDHRVSALWLAPVAATAVYVFAHGAGAGMRHAFMAGMADALAHRGVATLRFQFPAMEEGLRRPDRPALAHAAVRAAVTTAARLAPSLPLFAGGKSFGGRMTSQAQALAPLPGVHGLVFLGFPLYPANRPSIERAAHLADVVVPMLFVQGTRDALADPALLIPVVEQLGSRATLHAIEGADHAFRVPARSGRTQDDILMSVADAVTAWSRRT